MGSLTANAVASWGPLEFRTRGPQVRFCNTLQYISIIDSCCWKHWQIGTQKRRNDWDARCNKKIEIKKQLVFRQQFDGFAYRILIASSYMAVLCARSEPFSNWPNLRRILRFRSRVVGISKSCIAKARFAPQLYFE